MRRQGNVSQSPDAWDARIAKACGTYPAGVDNLLCTSNSLTDTLT